MSLQVDFIYYSVMKVWTKIFDLTFISVKASSTNNNTVFAYNLTYVDYYCVLGIVKSRTLTKIRID